MNLFTRREWMFLAFILIYSFVPNFAGLLRVVDLSVGTTVFPENPRAIAAPFPIVLHILSSCVFCILGAFQFLPGFRHRNLTLHRIMGRVVALAGLASASTGFWMTIVFVFPPELQGVLLYWVRLVVSLLMGWFIVSAVIAVRTGNIASHRTAMIRAYAIGQGASTQAVLGIGWMIAFGTELLGPWRDVAMVAAWCINLLAVEMWIRTKTSSDPSFIPKHHRPPETAVTQS